MVGMVLQSLMVTFDLFFISKLGTSYTSAASMATSMLHVTFATAALTAAGAIAIAARSVGEGQWDKVRSATGNGIMLSLMVGTLLALVCFFATDFLLRTIYRTSDPELLGLATSYLKVGFWTIPFLYVSGCLRSIMQGTGDTVKPLIIFGAANVINIILDPLFIFGLDLGLSGAALATLVSLIVASLWTIHAVVHSVYEGSYGALVASLKLEAQRVSQIFKIGFWASLQQVARPITGLVMMSIVLQAGGKPATAAFGIGMQLFGYTFIIISGIATSMAILSGQALGRKDLTEISSLVKSGLLLVFANVMVFSIPYVFFPDVFFRFFLDDPAVLTVGRSYLRIIFACMPLVCFSIVYAGVFNGSGMTRPPMTASLVANVAFKLPAAYVLAIPMGMGTNGVWTAISVSILIEAFILTLYYRQGKWKTFSIE